MTVKKIEALADALSFYNKAYQADSESYRLRNPLMLRNYAPPGKHKITDSGVRVFDSFLGGYKAALYDLKIKLGGESNSGIRPTDCLRNLLAVYQINQEQDILVVCYFLRKALADPTITALTPLSYFKEN
jgi:hypothetical protein